MKILVLNGSPRKGNTLTAINSFVKGVSCEHEVEVVDTYKLDVSPCTGCRACQCYKGCVAKDDSNMIVDKIVDADLLVFATPVYWWGITAQLKMVIDKCYCKGAYLKNKKAGIIVVGGAETNDKQYELIKGQFDCISGYLSWDLLFYNAYSATQNDDLANNESAIKELESLGALLDSEK